MKLDKETIIAILICCAFLLAWPHMVRKIWPQSAQQNVSATNNNIPAGESAASAAETTATADIAKTDGKAPVAVTAETVSQEQTQSVETKIKKTVEKILPLSPKIKQLDPVTLENDFIIATIDPNKSCVSSVLLKKHKDLANKVDIVLLKGVKHGALELFPADTDWVLTSVDASRSKSGTPEETVLVKRTFKTATGEPFTINQTWSVKADYIIISRIEIRDLSTAPIELKNLRISAGGIPKITELAGDKVFRENFEMDYYNTTEEKLYSKTADPGAGFFAMITGSAKDKPKKGFSETVNTDAKWIGVSNKYFTSLLVPEYSFKNGLTERAVVMKNKENKDYIMAETYGIIDSVSVMPDKPLQMNFKYLAGPKTVELLKRLDPSATKVMKLYMMGMIFLEPLSRLMLHMLLLLRDWCGSYGLSIILLTLIVKTLLWPFTNFANKSMKKMQKIQPLVKELKKKYKDNPQQMNMETMKLYKEHKVNPAGGCLPMLIQMPIFFALYATLSGSIEPRHTAFLWAKNLAMPDTVGHILGLPINPLMLMMAATMFLQQKLTPAAADPAQQKMMMFMPLVMLVMLYSLPSGLTLYWTVSQFITIAQLLVNRYFDKRAELKEAGA